MHDLDVEACHLFLEDAELLRRNDDVCERRGVRPRVELESLHDVGHSCCVVLSRHSDGLESIVGHGACESKCGEEQAGDEEFDHLGWNV